jgi:hypothetical protein
MRSFDPNGYHFLVSETISKKHDDGILQKAYTNRF